MIDIKILFDNSGRLAIETPSWGHCYGNDVRRAAQDTMHILSGEPTTEWEGNELNTDLFPFDTRGGSEFKFDDITQILDEGTHGRQECEFFKMLQESTDD
jgi:hypothetical protein